MSVKRETEPKCQWCGGRGGDVVPLAPRPEYLGLLVTVRTPIHVHDYHRTEMDGYLRAVAKRSLPTLVTVLVVAAAITVGAIGSVSQLTVAGLILLGLWAISFPTPTPEAVAWLGARKSQAVVRWCGAAILLVGLVWLGYGLAVGWDALGRSLAAELP